MKNPGARRFEQAYAKRAPRPVDGWTNLELLTTALGDHTAALSVCEAIGADPNGKDGLILSKLDGAQLLHLLGISKARALLYDVLFELACRIG